MSSYLPVAFTLSSHLPIAFILSLYLPVAFSFSIYFLSITFPSCLQLQFTLSTYFATKIHVDFIFGSIFFVFIIPDYIKKKILIQRTRFTLSSYLPVSVTLSSYLPVSVTLSSYLPITLTLPSY